MKFQRQYLQLDSEIEWICFELNLEDTSKWNWELSGKNLGYDSWFVEVSVLNGHIRLLNHLPKIEVIKDPICEECGEENELQSISSFAKKRFDDV